MALSDELRGMLAEFGLESLADWVVEQEVAGQTPEQIVVDIRERPEYKVRFPAMEELRKQAIKNNMPSITESQYLQMEASYKQALFNSGLPPGMFDSADDFKRLLEAQVDPTEVQDRVAAAKIAVNQTDPYVRGQMRDLYGITDTDLMAYALDPKRNSEYIRRVATTATLAGLAQRQNMAADLGTWERFGQEAVNQRLDQAGIEGAISQTALLKAQQQRLAAIEGEGYSTEEALSTVVTKDAAKMMKSQRRADRERARFASKSGITTQSLQGESL